MGKFKVPSSKIANRKTSVVKKKDPNFGQPSLQKKTLGTNGI